MLAYFHCKDDHGSFEYNHFDFVWESRVKLGPKVQKRFFVCKRAPREPTLAWAQHVGLCGNDIEDEEAVSLK